MALVSRRIFGSKLACIAVDTGIGSIGSTIQTGIVTGNTRVIEIEESCNASAL